MAKYIVQHRRGTTAEWLSIGTVLREGEIGIEYADEEQSEVRLLIGTKNGINALPFASVSKIRTISLPADGWIGDASPFSQDVSIEGVTKNSKIDLQPTPDQLAQLQDDETSLVVENNDTSVTVYAIGEKPSIDLILQCVITEVSTNG